MGTEEDKYLGTSSFNRITYHQSFDDSSDSEDEFEQAADPRENAGANENQAMIVDYSKLTMKELKHKKEDLYKEIIPAYEEGDLDTNQSKEKLRNLLNIRYQILARNQLKKQFGIDVHALYHKYHLFAGSSSDLNQTYKKKIVALSNGISDPPKKSVDYLDKPSKKDLKEIGELYKQIKKLETKDLEKARSLVKILHNKLQPELNKKLQYLNDRHSYDYYDLSRSKTLQKARIHDIDSKNILITNSKERLTHRSYNHKTFDFDIHTKNKKELKQLEEKYNKSLASLIKKSRKQEVPGLNERIKWTIGQLRDVRLHLYVVRNVDRVSSIDLREFCEKYAPRIGENPQRLYRSFQLTLADHLKTSGSNLSERQSIDEEYQELKKADSEITWNESKKKINELCSKIFQVLEHNGLIEANAYKYKNDLENAVPEISKERSEYVELGIKDLRKTKKKLYDEIIKAYRNGYVDTPSFKENLRDLLEVRYQIAMKKGVKRNVFSLMTKAENSVATKSYNYYDLSTSNTLKKAGIHNIDSKMILSKENEYTLNEQDQEYLTKNEQELEQELADLKNLKNTLDKQSSEQTDPRLKKQMEVGLAELTAQIEDTSLHHRVLRDINEFVGIDLQEFCEKYARRVGEDPQKLHYMFQKKAVEKLKTYNGNVEETKSELKFVAESYESIKQDDKKKYWKKANREINTLISKINNVYETDELIESQHLKEPRLSVEEGQSSRSSFDQSARSSQAGSEFSISSSLLDKENDANPEETNLYLEARNTTLASEIKGATDGLGKPACNFKTGSNTSNQSNLTDKEINPNPEVTQLSGNSKEEGKTGSLDQLTSQTKKTSLFRATYANIRDLQDNLIYQKKARQLSNEEGNNGKFNNGEVENGKVDNGRLSNGQKKELRVILGDCGTQVVKIDSQSERPTASPNLVSRVNNPKGAVGYDR
ncbi:hypothetical protein ACG7HM_001314 [Enterococcus hirae]|uniref:Uncharacterized protein n=1 Tax=Enterococcus hirae TaxID=1354 RepID=A0AB37IJ79_ENTHR|nr:hypothetical protein [Enterococcus hirae]RBT42096.1 hypothetical protein EB07_01504 [Enterococcus hirae]RBT49330.1 hypothetical protein EB10_02146 [Enterococcus hirae]RBT53057.1 hypothetical protein EB24_02236 [Enterococcus hirae]RBT56473.1 hypothetical protein EA74_00127 [Enterococcus hirae]RBT59410.1 hypothetical protein EB39_02161 [Enterococcus hirae]